MQEVLLGTIGSGSIVNSILSNAKKVKGIKLVATYSRSLEKANALKEKYGAQLAYDNLDEFINCDKINTIYIASPNSLHYVQAKKALLAKKNVILEKPFTPTLNEAKELLALAKQNGVIILDATPTYFLPNLNILKNSIDEIGQVRLIMGNYSQYSSKYDALLRGELPNVFNVEFAGGSLMDINYYNVYLTLYLFSNPTKATYLANIHENGIDTSGVVNMDYGNYKASLIGCKDTWGVNYYQIEGEKGYIYVKNGPNVLEEIKVVSKTGETILNEQDILDRWYYGILGITNTLLNEDMQFIEGNHKVMLETIELIEKIRKDANINFIGD